MLSLKVKIKMHNVKLISLLIIIISLGLSDGPYEVQLITEQDGLRNGPDYSNGKVYFPANSNENLPIFVMVPGFISYISSIEEWGPYLASYGVVTMFVNVNSIFQDPYSRADAILDGITTIKLENERLNSPLNGRLNLDGLAVGGWSMGATSYEIYHAGNKPSLATLGYTGASNANYITNNNQLTNGCGYGTGDITQVVAGTCLTGGGTSGCVTINHSDTSSQSSVNNSNGTVIQDVTLDGYGHVTSLGSANLDSRYYTESEIQTFLNQSYIDIFHSLISCKSYLD